MNAASDISRPLAPLALRRRHVLIGVLGFVVLLLSQFLRGAGLPSALLGSLTALGFVILVFGWSRLVLPGRSGLPQANDPSLDERQRSVVTAAYAQAYGVLAACLLLGCAYVVLAGTFPGLPTLGTLADGSVLLVG